MDQLQPTGNHSTPDSGDRLPDLDAHRHRLLVVNRHAGHHHPGKASAADLLEEVPPFHHRFPGGVPGVLYTFPASM
jgi:hypothetical protein